LLLPSFHCQWLLSLRHRRRHRLVCVLSPWLEVILVVVVLNFSDSSTRAAFFNSRCESLVSLVRVTHIKAVPKRGVGLATGDWLEFAPQN
jgi:hypothetical protein